MEACDGLNCGGVRGAVASGDRVSGEFVIETLDSGGQVHHQGECHRYRVRRVR